MNHVNQILQRRFALSLGISALIFVAELAGGFWTGSLTLLSYFVHIFLDFFYTCSQLYHVARFHSSR
jgi:Co/Zn/Cd efflux system component